MPAWKQQLHRTARAKGHKLSPITRISPRAKGAKLNAQSNEYEAFCQNPGCTLYVKAITYPGSKVSIKVGGTGGEKWESVQL